MKTFLWTCALSLLLGCVSQTSTGGSTLVNLARARVYLAPFQNATSDENAAGTLADLTGTALAQRGIDVVGDGAPRPKTGPAEVPSDPAGGAVRQAREAQATHLLTGNVHEYRYKTDLNGDPAVGLTLRLVDLADGRTVWQGTSSQVGVAFASSLTSTAQKAVNKLVGRLPVRK